MCPVFNFHSFQFIFILFLKCLSLRRLNKCKWIIQILNFNNFKFCCRSVAVVAGPHRGPQPHLWNITVKHMYSKSVKQKQRVQWRSEARTPQTGPRWGRPQILIVRHRPSETVWGRSRHLDWGPTRRRAIKVGSKAITPHWVNNSACSLSQNIYVQVTCLAPLV